MKRILFYITFALVVLFSCTRDEMPSKISYEFSDVKALPDFTTCLITCCNESVDGEGIKARLLLSESEDMEEAARFPIQVSGDTLSCSLTGLQHGTVYYYGFEMFTNTESYRAKDIYSFKTREGEEVIVTTFEITNITQTTATGGGNVTVNGDVSIQERGICWSLHPNPYHFQDNHATNGYGIGWFSVDMTDLLPDTTYYVKAYAVHGSSITYGNELNFHTLSSDLPIVVTGQVTNITSTTATVQGNVIYEGAEPVTERGVCWDTVHNPFIWNNHASNGEGLGNYSCMMTDLVPNRTYYVRAYAKTGQITAYGEELCFITSPVSGYTISVSANPSNGGTATGGGMYNHGQSCTVIATAANGYSFTNWTEGDNVVSTNANYTFTVNTNRMLMANFSEQAPNTYTINASPKPSNGGTVTGGGSYQQGQSCTVTATANTGYTFQRWTENSNQVSTNANYTFTVTGNRTLEAQFQEQSYVISASADPTSGGSVFGSGSYNYGQSCTLTATATTGYTFVRWIENGNQVSTNANYTFTVTGNRTLVAQFQVQSYSIGASANPSNGGAATGGGTYNYGQSCMVIATAASGYGFTNWTEGSNVVSTNANYTFTVSGNRTLVANFSLQAPNTYTINVSPNPSAGGTVTGGGSYQQGQSCTVTATANTGYTFLRWTENGNQVYTNANYTFTVTGNRTLVAQFQAQSYTVGVSANPSSGGSVSGGGSYNYGQSCTVHAIANTGYTFLRWTENGNQVSTNANYTFTVTGSRTLVAQFQAQSYTITASANPSSSGSVSGGGNYNYGQSCTLYATANSGYTFANWTENGSQVSANANYTFTVTSNRTLVANFTYNGGGNAPVGAINGLFTINANGDQVYFSQGNLQYQASTNTWRFAENQWDCVGGTNSMFGISFGNVEGSSNNYHSPTYDGWIDMFGWGTSGYDHGANAYQPWSNNSNPQDYYAYGLWNANLNDQTGQADWGYNSISNGGNVNNQWRTLTGGDGGEWDYVFNIRSTSSGVRFARACVNDVNGIILLPDNWSVSYYILNNTNMGTTSFNSNVISISQWEILEQHGAVFLPAGGYRDPTGGIYGSCGYYGTASYATSYSSYCLYFHETAHDVTGSNSRTHGRTIRLVKDYNR